MVPESQCLTIKIKILKTIDITNLSSINCKGTQDALRSDSEDYAIKDGLEDWLEALGPLVIPEAVAGRRGRKPWSR